MEKNNLIIVTGKPATGKTTLAKKIEQEFNLPLICKDEIKEALFDYLGYKDREWSKKIGLASFYLIREFLKIFMKTRRSVMIETHLLADLENEYFQKITEKYNLSPLQIICHTRGEVLLERFKMRSESGNRHPGHVDHLNYDEFEEYLLQGKQEPLDITGQIIELDTTDLENIKYDEVFESIKKVLENNDET